jgi:glycosyltransferase involved in cell wall biosynthesis
MLAYQSADIGVAKALIATSAQEYENLRSLGLKQPIAVIPNGVKLPENPHDIENSRGRGENGMRKVSFMSRIHPVKGLLNLVNAWSRIEPDGWILNIAGPGEGPYLDEVRSLVRTLQLSDSVKILGELQGAAKSELFRDSDIFVLPSFSENFGIVVAEALAYGVPVITTTGAPWASLEDYDCGWQVDVGVNPMVAALRNAILLSDDQRMEMGQRGRILAQRYDWGVIAGQTADVYRWVLGQQSRPDCVHLA